MNNPLFLEFTAEFRLLLASALFPLDADQADRLCALCNLSIDWKTFEALANRHGLVPITYRNLSSHLADIVPPETLFSLKEQAEHNQQRVFKYLAELRKIAGWFTNSGIQLCSLKGSILSQLLFGDAAIRFSNDLDLLVPYESVSQAETLILANGYQRDQPAIPLSPRQWQVYQQEWYHYSYVHPGRKTCIELHWAITSPNFVSMEFTRQLITRSQELTAAGVNIFTLSDKDLPVYLLIHGARHNWGRLKWLVDFAAWMRQTNDSDWESLTARMRELGLQRPLIQGVLLANWLFSLPVPEIVEKLEQSNPKVQSLAKQAVKAILETKYYGNKPGQFRRLKHTFYLMKLKAGFNYRWTTFSKIWVFPRDWQDVPLPDALFPLYGLLRPFLWLWRYHLSPQKH